MDFIKIGKVGKKENEYLRPFFYANEKSDIMVRGGAFVACWDEANHIWSKSEMRLLQIIDEEMSAYQIDEALGIKKKYAADFSSGILRDLKNFIKAHPDSYQELDAKLVYLSQETKKNDYSTRRLSYDLDSSFPAAYDKLVSKLYSQEERDKFEWAIGSIFAGDSVRLQKFFVFYGDVGTGKSTVLNIIHKLFEPYAISFNAESIGKADARFALEDFASNPLVGIQQDSDLSTIETNARLNSLISHDSMVLEQKFKPAVNFKSRAILFVGTNKPVKITDAKSGLKRRLVDIHPTGEKHSFEEYSRLTSQVEFELGQIANYCLEKYKKMGFNYYDKYLPQEMVEETNYFYNFVADKIEEFKDGISLKRAYDMYKEYCDDSGYTWKLSKMVFKHEFKEYFDIMESNVSVNGIYHRYFFRGPKLLSITTGENVESVDSLSCTTSLLDDILADCPAQLADVDDKPSLKWDDVKLSLRDIDTTKTHYVRPPQNHIVIDFDLKDESGQKSLKLNLEAAANFPETYMEVSKGGAGIHLHYIYQGDVSELSYIYAPGIEVKTFPGKSSLRRRVSHCNDKPIATISSGLPKKGVKRVIDFDKTMNEQSIRAMILRNCQKEYHPYTTPSVQFIKKLLDDMYERGEPYDVTDMRNGVMTFASHSNNQATYCIKLVNQMHFSSKDPIDDKPYSEEAPLVFFDCEVFPNLFIVCWKLAGEEHECVRMINPTGEEIGELIHGKYRLVGFNCRRYDNHILYARYIGESNAALYRRSQGIIGRHDNSCLFGAAYNVSYTDVYDFASAGNKKGLKKWEIELGLKHQECPYPWDQPASEEVWNEIADYCCNDVEATEAVFNHLQGDWTARLILSELSGLTPNDTTNNHTIKIVFGDEKNPNSYLKYTDLRETFPGYEFKSGKSTYLGDEVGEGGYVYAEPGMYYNVVVFDVASMHPTSIEELNLFGKYTQRYSDLKKARVAIKHDDKEALQKLLGGALVPFVEREGYSPKALSNALKTALNSAYGLTSAHFPNAFRDPHNIDNIVAKRGALFMCQLRHKVQELGYKVIHCKTDSIKVVNPDKFIENYILDFGKKYGYEFEVENVYERICLVNNAVYIAAHEDGEWDATGAQFAEPYVFKILFSHEEIEMRDLWQTKSVKSGAMYLKDETTTRFVGTTGAFLPVVDGCSLVRIDGEKEAAVTGTKDWLWCEAVDCDDISKVDMEYYRNLVDDAIADIRSFGDFERFADFNCKEDASLPF